MIRRVCSSSTIAVGGRLEQDDVVRALAVAIDRVGQPAAAPGGDLHDLAAGGDDLAGGPVDEGLALVVRDVRADDEHEFVAAHTRDTPSNGDAPLTVVPARSGKDQSAESSTSRGRGPPSTGRPSVSSERDPTASGPAGHTVEAPCPPAPSCSSNPTAASRRDASPRSWPTPGTRSPGPTDPDEALASAADHQLRHHRPRRPGRSSAVDICREIRATPALAAVPVMCVSATDDVEERIRFLEAGADDVMARPFDARELEARVEALLLRFQRSKDLAPIVSADGVTMHRARRTVAVYSPKGGVGTTTIATNSPSPRRATARPGRPRRPRTPVRRRRDATSNLDPKQTLADLVRDDSALREPELLRTYAMRHDSGLHVLAAPAAPGGRRDASPRPTSARS